MVGVKQIAKTCKIVFKVTGKDIENDNHMLGQHFTNTQRDFNAHNINGEGSHDIGFKMYHSTGYILTRRGYLSSY